MAGTSLSFERSPLAPKMTIAHGAAVRMGPSLLDARVHSPRARAARPLPFRWLDVARARGVTRARHIHRRGRTSKGTAGARKCNRARAAESQVRPQAEFSCG